MADEHQPDAEGSAKWLNNNAYFKSVVKKHSEQYATLLQSDVSDEVLRSANIAHRTIQIMVSDLLSPIKGDQSKRSIRKDDK